jgi:hypothetical protein
MFIVKHVVPWDRLPEGQQEGVFSNILHVWMAMPGCLAAFP